MLSIGVLPIKISYISRLTVSGQFTAVYPSNEQHLAR